MGILDDLTKQAGGLGGLGNLTNLGNLGGLAEAAMKNPQAVAAVVSLLSSKDSSVGGTGGLGGLLQAFQGRGLGSMISSWVSTGPNPPISAGQITDVLGADTLSQFAGKAGVSSGEAGGLLASLLPTVIDQLTPDGRIPDTNAFESTLGGLLKTIGR